MKLYITAPYDPDGIEEIETVCPPYRNAFGQSVIVYDKGKGRTTSVDWYREGVTWHRTKKDARAAAKKFRERWIAETAKKAATIAALPPL